MLGQSFDSRGDRHARIEAMTRYFEGASVPVSMDDAWSENSAEAERRGKNFSEHDIRRAAWKALVAGGLGVLIRGSVSFNEDAWFRMANFEQELESEQWLRLVNSLVDNRLGSTFGSMVPERSLVEGGYCIADPERKMLLCLKIGRNDRYDPDGDDTVLLRLSSLVGSYDATWLDPRTGEESPAGVLRGGADHRIEPPSDDDWVLILSRADQEPSLR
jgi:hypothetical protein